MHTVFDLVKCLSGVEVFQSYELYFAVLKFVVNLQLVSQKLPQITEQSLIANLASLVLFGLFSSFVTTVRVQSRLKTVFIKTVWFQSCAVYNRVAPPLCNESN